LGYVCFGIYFVGLDQEYWILLIYMIFIKVGLSKESVYVDNGL